jgi:glycosyltransferase involved in cell wall biosynthesis
VIVPFLGSPTEAEAAIEGLRSLSLGEGDEVLLVDNGSSAPLDAGAVRVVHASEIRSSYHARNAGVMASRNPWVLFIDSDCRPSPSLIDDYFADELPDRCGIVAGEVDGDPSQRGIAARHAIDKSHLSSAAYRTIAPRPVAATVNMLVARATWDDLGGFCEVRSGADFEFCLRAGSRGWKLVYQPRARVVHLHPERLRETLAKARRYGAGQRWLEQRVPGSGVRPRLGRRLAGALAGTVGFAVTGRFERARFKAIDGLWHTSYAWGYRTGDNSPER